MSPTRIIKSGKPVWRIYMGQQDGRKSYKQFKTKTDADIYLRNEKARRAAHGRMAFEAPPEKVAEALELSKMLAEKGATLREATNFYLEHLNETRKPSLLSEAIRLYLADIKPTLAPQTVGDYRKRLKRFLIGREEKRVDQITEDVRPFLNDSLEKESRQSADNYRRSLSAFFTWAVVHHMIRTNPCKGIKTFLSKKKGKAVVFSPEEVALIMRKLESDFDVEVAGYVVASIFGGVRPLEFRKKITKDGKQIKVALEWESISVDNGEVAISEDLSKTNLFRAVDNETLKTWLLWIEDRHGRKLVGPIVDPQFRHKWLDWRKRNVPQLHFAPDIMRHSFGTYRLKALKSAGAVALEMGNSESIVKRYYLDARRPLSEAEAFWAISPAPSSAVAA